MLNNILGELNKQRKDMQKRRPQWFVIKEPDSWQNPWQATKRLTKKHILYPYLQKLLWKTHYW